MFFALSLGLLARGKFNLYYLVFAVASLNRETTFLLGLFFMVYFFKKIPFRSYLLGLAYQGLAYVVIKLAVMAAYASLPGEAVQWRPFEVLKGYVDQPVWFAVLFFIAFVALVLMALYHWNGKPEFLRVAFLTVFPLLLMLHIFLGYSYEIRVFAEVFPVIFLLCAWPIVNAGQRNALQIAS